MELGIWLILASFPLYYFDPENLLEVILIILVAPVSFIGMVCSILKGIKT